MAPNPKKCRHNSIIFRIFVENVCDDAIFSDMDMGHWFGCEQLPLREEGC